MAKKTRFIFATVSAFCSVLRIHVSLRQIVSVVKSIQFLLDLIVGDESSGIIGGHDVLIVIRGEAGCFDVSDAQVADFL